MNKAVKITKWGNSLGIRLPKEALKEADMQINDAVYIENIGRGRVLIQKTPSPKKGTIEYLFKDYSGETFKTELADMGEPVGNEKW